MALESPLGQLYGAGVATVFHSVGVAGFQKRWSRCFFLAHGMVCDFNLRPLEVGYVLLMHFQLRIKIRKSPYHGTDSGHAHGRTHFKKRFFPNALDHVEIQWDIGQRPQSLRLVEK